MLPDTILGCFPPGEDHSLRVRGQEDVGRLGERVVRWEPPKVRIQGGGIPKPIGLRIRGSEPWEAHAGSPALDSLSGDAFARRGNDEVGCRRSPSRDQITPASIDPGFSSHQMAPTGAGSNARLSAAAGGVSKPLGADL